MKVREMLILLQQVDGDKEVVVQRNHDGGAYSHHYAILWPDGHIGYSGPIIMIGEQVEARAALSEGEK